MDDSVFLTCWVPDPIETCAEMPWSIEMSFDSVSDFAEIEKKIVCQLYNSISLGIMVHNEFQSRDVDDWRVVIICKIKVKPA